MAIIKELEEILKAKKGASPPERVHIPELRELLHWFEQTLCTRQFIDPRGDRVRFECQRFFYLIKLCNTDGSQIRKPLREVEKIRSGIKTKDHYGNPNTERMATLSWIPCCIEEPTAIIKNRHPHVPGDEIYVKKFDKSGLLYKEVICLRFRSVLVPVTSFLVKKLIIFEAEDVLWIK